MKRSFGMDPAERAELKKKVSLVERNTEPQGIPLVNPFAVARHDSSDLVELAKEIQNADSFVRTSACGKLQVIAEQMRFLQQQAQKVLQEAKQHKGLHHAACNFRKIPGHIYYLYQRPSGQQYFSMLSPEDWGSQSGAPHDYRGAYRLEHDFSWTPESQMEVRGNELSMLNKILNTNETISITYAFENEKCNVEDMDST